MSLVSKGSPSIIGLMFMGSVVLIICSTGCVLYSAGCGMKRVLLLCLYRCVLMLW